MTALQTPLSIVVDPISVSLEGPYSRELFQANITFVLNVLKIYMPKDFAPGLKARCANWAIE